MSDGDDYARRGKEELTLLPTKAIIAMLKERGLKSTGRKDALVNRLYEGWFNTRAATSEIQQTGQSTNPIYCCIPECHNNTHTEGISLHRLPTGQQRKSIRRLWIQRLRNVRANLILSSSTRVCSHHFQPADFSNNVLKSSAIPTIFPSKPILVRKMRTNPLEKIRVQDTNTCFSEPISCSVTKTILSNAETETIAQNTVVESSEMFCETTANLDIATQTCIRQSFTCKKCDKNLPVMKDFSCQTVLPDINIRDLRKDDRKTRFFTGFVNFGTFMVLLNTLVKHANGRLNYWVGEESLIDKDYHQGRQKPGPKRQLDLETEFLMTMMWYRLGLLQEHLSTIFKVSVSTVSRILTTWSQFMYEHTSGLVYLPTREQVLMHMPSHFINHQNVYMVLDCTEFFIEKPSGLEAQAVTWSEYKHHCTIKSLIGVSPTGMTTFISRAWGGRASDRHIVEKENILDLIPEGMAIMADKGFEVEDLAPRGIDIIIPPKVSSKYQMSDYEFFKTVDIAESRIVVEMKMEQAKNYQILQSVIPISRITTAEQVIFNCFAFTNLLPPLFAPASASDSDLPIYRTCPDQS